MSTICTVEELNNQIRNTININFKEVKIQGELAEIKISNGNLYGKLKDNKSVINIVIWRSSYKVKNGDKVIIIGNLNFFIKNGVYNIIVSDLEHVGTGDIHKELHELKLRCEKYFNKEKKDIPKIINKLGILTASDSAALQDVLYVLKSNNFNGHVYIKHCNVQGKNCQNSVISGIKYFEDKDIDALLITRGGGSVEDLFGFSDENVIKTIYDSSKFIISAIGHEIDFMLSDFVADHRAPTPSIAGEFISQTHKNVITNLYNKKQKLEHIKSLIEYKLHSYKMQLDSLKTNMRSPLQEIEDKLVYFKEKRNDIFEKIKNKKETLQNKLLYLEHKLDNHNCDRILEAGYSLILSKGIIIDSVDKLPKKFKIKFHDGTIMVTQEIDKNT